MCPQRRRRLLVHTHSPPGGPQRDVRGEFRANLGFDGLGLPYQHQLVAREPFGGGEGTRNDLPRSVVSAEGIYRDTHW
jgi:hypothetical protein